MLLESQLLVRFAIESLLELVPLQNGLNRFAILCDSFWFWWQFTAHSRV